MITQPVMIVGKRLEHIEPHTLQGASQVSPERKCAVGRLVLGADRPRSRNDPRPDGGRSGCVVGGVLESGMAARNCVTRAPGVGGRVERQAALALVARRRQVGVGGVVGVRRDHGEEAVRVGVAGVGDDGGIELLAGAADTASARTSPAASADPMNSSHPEYVSASASLGLRSSTRW